MHEWAIRTLTYAITYGFLSLAIYLVLPWLVRMIAVHLVKGVGDAVVKELKDRSQGLLQKGREHALSGPQTKIIGHLVEPYLERLAGWFMSKISEQRHEHLTEHYADACVDRLRRYRWRVSFAVAQIIMILLAFGYILRGVL